MIICHCRVVRDEQIRAQLDSGACPMRELVAGCGAGTECGGCLPSVRALLDERGPWVQAVEPRGATRPGALGIASA